MPAPTLILLSDPACASAVTEGTDGAGLAVVVAGSVVEIDAETVLVVEVGKVDGVETTDVEAGRPLYGPTVAPARRKTATEVLQQRCLSACDSQQYSASFA